MRVIHKANWDCLDNSEVVLLFDKELKGVAIQPGQAVVNELRRLGVATLEVYEDRTSSTVYRIRQTGEVFQVEQMSGETFIFDDAEEYHAAQPIDQLIESFAAADPKYTVIEDGDCLIITRTKPPRFVVRYHPGKLENIEVVRWIDPIRHERIPKIMTSIGKVANRYLKNHERKNTKRPGGTPSENK